MPTKLRSADLPQHFAQLHPSLNMMDVCGAMQHWAREFGKLSHKVKLIRSRFVQPLVKTNKNDVANVWAI